jgi:hypothetical protein
MARILKKEVMLPHSVFPTRTFKPATAFITFLYSDHLDFCPEDVLFFFFFLSRNNEVLSSNSLLTETIERIFRN